MGQRGRLTTLAVQCLASPARWHWQQPSGQSMPWRRPPAASWESVSSVGHICSTIGCLWVKAGHPVLFSSRHPEKLKELVAELGPLAQNGTVQQAIAFGDALLIAVPYGALPQIGQEYSDMLKGKIMLDACNAVPARDGAVAEEVERDRNRDRFAEISARHVARARVQYAFLYDLRARGEPS